MSINSEKREERDKRNRKRYEAIAQVLAGLWLLCLIVLIIGLIEINTDIILGSFFALLLISGPLGWMSSGRIKDMGNDGIPFWWGV
jgi:hypothetical protein